MSGAGNRAGQAQCQDERRDYAAPSPAYTPNMETDRQNEMGDEVAAALGRVGGVRDKLACEVVQRPSLVTFFAGAGTRRSGAVVANTHVQFMPPVIWWNNMEPAMLVVDDVGGRDLLM